MKSRKKDGRKKSIVLLAILGVFLILFSILTVIPYSFGIREYKPVIDNISLGIDLRGGVYMVLEADGTDENGEVIPADEFNRSLEGTISTLTSRLVGKGFTESTVVRQGDKRIRIEIPDVEDPESVFEIIGKPAVLQFRDESGNVLLEGSKHLQSAFPTYDENGNPAVGLTLNDEGTRLFAEATRNNINKTISIYIDEDEVSTPRVQTEITNGKPIITNIGTVQQAEDFAMLLQSGALPLKMNEFEKGTVSPTLGQDALKSGIIAGAIGLALVIVFMCVYYKGLGIASSISLFIYTLLLLYAIAGMPAAFSLSIIPKAQLTLPSIAGIILSIGMAIDANVIIYEQIKDEYRLGKSLENSIKVGFKRAFSAILDSNVTTLFAAIILLWLGTGSIKGFAIVLLYGILLAVFCGLVVTRIILSLVINLTKKGSFYGLKREEEITPRGIMKKDFKIVENKKKTFSVSLSIMALGLIFMIIFGLNRGLDFTGGNIVTVNFGQQLTAPSEEGSNYSVFTGIINKTIDDYAAENNVAIDKNTPQFVGLEHNNGITVRFNIRGSFSDQELMTMNDEINNLLKDNINAKLDELGLAPLEANALDTASVGSTISKELISSAVLSIAVAAVLMLIYLAFRFEILMGLASVIALMHDVLIMVALVAIFQYQINSSFVAAMITIIGYSINATIVIFDKVRENLKRLSLKEATYAQIANKSVKETIMRSINTSITTLTSVVALFILGVATIKEFVFPIIVGILAGTYSSVFLSVALWVTFKNLNDKRKAAREKAKSAATAAAKAKKAAV